KVQFPCECNEKYLTLMFEKIEPVIDVEITNISSNDSKTDYSFHYTLFDEKDKAYVEEYINGIGGKILNITD
ncbi:MAG: prephenate dehydrogenase, partial [Methanobrevibacter sp.]|nr:prephenate dehydrogenase [Methanobrevibacter sp.]